MGEKHGHGVGCILDGLGIGYGKAPLAITVDLNKELHMIDFKNRDYMYSTSIECISFADETIPPTLLIYGVNILQKRCRHNDLGWQHCDWYN